MLIFRLVCALFKVWRSRKRWEKNILCSSVIWQQCGLHFFPFFCSILQAVDIRQIYDKFPEKKGGLKELYDKGPQPVFFLVKFWVSFINFWEELVLVFLSHVSIPNCCLFCKIYFTAFAFTTYNRTQLLKINCFVNENCVLYNPRLI